MEILCLSAGLFILMGANIVLGSIGAWLSGGFKGETLVRGIIKGLINITCIGAVWFAGYINPEILTTDLGGTMVNLSSAVTLLLTAAFIFYGAQVLKKISTFLGVKLQPEKNENGEIL